MELTFSKHPYLEAPTDEEILLLAEHDPKLLEQLYNAHEGRIKASVDDPVRYGFDLDGWDRMNNALTRAYEYVGRYNQNPATSVVGEGIPFDYTSTNSLIDPIYPNYPVG